MEHRVKNILALRIAYVAGIFSLIVCIVMLLNYWQLITTDPLDNKSLKALVEKFQDDNKNEELKQDIRNLDLMARNAYFTNQWQIRSGAYLLIGGIILTVAALRIYYASKSEIEIPDRKSSESDIELLITRRWILYTLAIIFGVALLGSFLSVDHLSKAYVLTEVEKDDERIPVLEIITDESSEAQIHDIQEVTKKEIQKENIIEAPAAKQEKEIDEIVETATHQANTETAIKKPENAPPAFPSHSDLVAQHPSFRGPYGLGISGHKNIPTSWNGLSGENILWKVKIPLQGYNSPVIWNNQVFLTGADKNNQSVYCYNLRTGELIWEHKVSGIRQTSSDEIKPTEDTGFAAPTAVTDGRYIFAIFATGDIVGLDMNGNRIWAQNLGVPDNHYGHSSSLLTWRDLLFIQFDTNDAGKVMALNTSNGALVWETGRISKISWASPILANFGDHMELVLSSSPQVAAYDPETGKELWAMDCLSGEIGPSPGFLNGVVFAANEYANLVAIKPGSPAKILWESNEYLPEVASPVALHDMLYIATSYGVIACFDAKTGNIIWEYECDQGFYSSPVVADNKVYFMDMDGIMHIFSTDKTMKLIGKPELGEQSVSTPAFVDGKILIRGYEHLYCIGR
ncbi:MAG: PQQ-binding-like beta-propeller repeat protein [Cytophagales bacterium]|nr:PQQ-binding-like beta-propeller repeat protein [Cytophagales bacterium]